VNLSEYFPILLFMLVGTAVGIAPLAVGKLLGPTKPNPEKNSPYECGFGAFEDARMKFDVRYYLIAILFILFDLETALLFPWAASALDGIRDGTGSAWPVLITVLIFVAELVIGFVYIWKKGALDWE
jgi:NADH-quinone oxidoreductase subunit A